MTQTLTSPDQIARALWYVDRELVALREEQLPKLADGEAVEVETLYSAISRGTERLIFTGRVPETEWDRMRAPLQQGAFPFPVKYGYCAVGRVVNGPQSLNGKLVFCLHPHQDRFVAVANNVVLIPDGVPAKRAVLAANVETALNAVWDARVLPGDRVIVIGAGIVGLLIAAVACRILGTDVSVVDRSDATRNEAAALGVPFIMAGDADDLAAADVVFHTTATGGGLQSAIRAAGMEATVCEVSWYGDREINVGLGGAFHSKRLKLVSSQVGQIAEPQRTRWDYRRRLGKALEILAEPAFDALVEDEVRFDDLPERMADILSDTATGLPPVIAYERSRS